MSTALIVGLSIGLGIPTLLLLRRAVKSNGRRESTFESHVKNNPWLFESKTSSEPDEPNKPHSENSRLIGGKKTRKSRKK
jgi:hypothetical protein